MKIGRLLLVAAFLVTVSGKAQDASVLKSRRAARDFPLTADPERAPWKDAPRVVTVTERWGKHEPGAYTEIRSRWSPGYLSFLFISRYQTLNRMPGTVAGKETWGLWDFDVVEVFVGSDLERIQLYKEFEVSPWEEWVDLDVDRSRPGNFVDWKWNSNFRFQSRIDEANHLWFCEIQIPWTSIDSRTPQPGNKLRLNLYRIEGPKADRKYIAWRPVNSPSYHTPEAFGSLLLE